MVVRVRYTDRKWGGWEVAKDGQPPESDVYFRIRDAQQRARNICREAGGGEVRTQSIGGAVLFVEEVVVDSDS